MGADREYRHFEDKQVVVICNPPRRGRLCFEYEVTGVGADREYTYFKDKQESKLRKANKIMDYR